MHLINPAFVSREAKSSSIQINFLISSQVNAAPGGHQMAGAVVRLLRPATDTNFGKKREEPQQNTAGERSTAEYSRKTATTVNSWGKYINEVQRR